MLFLLASLSSLIFPLAHAQTAPTQTLPQKTVQVQTPAPVLEPVQFPVEKWTLKNGLTVIVAPDPTVPLVSYHTWYRVGSRDESVGTTGAAHMLEHMMFKGAKKYSGKDFDRILHENGISNNAFTSWDYTGFYQNLPSSKLELMMDMEVDRMRFLNLRAEDLTSELQVVGEERRWRVDDNPQGLLREKLMGELYKAHPYTWPVIGYMKDIQAYTTEKLKYFYDKFYVPNNAVLVLSGDLDVKKTKSLIEKYYGALESKPLPERAYAPEPSRKNSVRREMTWNVQNASFQVGYQGVALGHPDSYALDLAAGILGEGSSSILHKSLVYESKMASWAGASNVSNMDPGFFQVGAALRPGLATEEAEALVEKAVQRLVNSKVSVRDLQKAKNQLMKDHVDSLTTIDGRAQALAMNEIALGDYRRLFTDMDEYNKVTVEDIQRVAKKYFVNSRKVTFVLKPKK